jgi:hypothetical protein
MWARKENGEGMVERGGVEGGKVGGGRERKGADGGAAENHYLELFIQYQTTATSSHFPNAEGCRIFWTCLVFSVLTEYFRYSQ